LARPWESPARGAWGTAKRKRPRARDQVTRGFERSAQLRAKLLFYVFALLAIFLLVHLFQIQVREGPKLAALAVEQRMETIDFAARRGPILDRDGNTLARSLPSQSVYVTTREVVDKVATAQALGAALGVPADRILARLRSRGSYVLVGRKIDHDVADRLVALKLAGVSVVSEETGQRFVPSGRLASTVLGFTGIDENGLDGIEYSFDRVLRGRPGQMALETDQWGRAIPFAAPHVREAARAGYGLVLTLDSYVQYNVERVLSQTVKAAHARSGSAIVMDPWTGELLALANVPDYNVDSYDKFPADARRDRAVTDAYEPGSTFKLITAAAALESKKVTTYDRFPKRDQLKIGDQVIHNAEDGFLAGGGGSETLEDIIAYSHNVGAAEVGLSIGRKTMAATLHRFGFGEDTRVGLPGESQGIVPPVADWSATSLPTIAFGHGIAITPLALARAYAAIANGGLLLRPRIVNAILAPDGGPIYHYAPEVERRVISTHTAAILRRYLRAAVVRGTGNPTAQVPGYTTAGKTGTAQIAEHGRYTPGEYVASFVGYIPAERPRYLILVKIERPRGLYYGSEVAAPAFARIARMLMMHAGVLPATLVKSVPASKRRV
jgi:cell division protein FtsI/penicillin-binding protein 2